MASEQLLMGPHEPSCGFHMIQRWDVRSVSVLIAAVWAHNILQLRSK